MARPAGSGMPGKLRWGPSARPIGRIPVQAYRQITGIPLQPSNAQAVVAGAAYQAPALVQPGVSGIGTGASVTLTLGSPTGTGHCLIVGIGEAENTTAPSVSGITLGGSADNFALAVKGSGASFTNAEIWADPGCAAGQTSVVVSFSGGTGGGQGQAVYAEEWSGLAVSSPVDKTSQGTGTSASWASGLTGTLSQAAELLWGVSAFFGGSTGTLTGPSSPWVNSSQVNEGTIVGLMAGHQPVTSATSQQYAGSISSSANWTAAIASLKAAAISGAAPGTASVQLGPSGLGNVWFPAQVTLSTTTGITTGLDTSIANLYLGPVVNATTLLGTVYGGNGVVAAALPDIQPGQFLIAQWTGATPGDVASMNVSGIMNALG